MKRLFTLTLFLTLTAGCGNQPSTTKDQSAADVQSIPPASVEYVSPFKDDVKTNAEQTLKSVSVDLATAKAQLEMQKEQPDLQEVNRLSTKAANLSAELGL